MTTREILTKIAKTGLLCGSLGYALYLILMVVVELPYAASAFLIIVAAIMSLLMFGEVRYALRHGYVPDRFKSIERAQQPFLFWGSIAFTTMCGVAMLYIAWASLF